MAVRSNPSAPALTPDVAAIRTQVERMLANGIFSRSRRMSRFLQFAVEQVLVGRSKELKEQLVGVKVFDRKPNYEPRIDAIVRVEARRLRRKLKLYYASAGRSDRIVIELCKGTYVPAFRIRGAEPTAFSKRALRGPETPKSILVLPFMKLGPESEEDSFSDGLIEELIHFLTRIPHIRVIARDSTKLRGCERDLLDIGRLKVETVLRGSVRRTEGHVRVAVQLIDAKTGVYLWAEAYDRELQNVFAIQEEMARTIVNALHLKLTSP